MDCTFFPDVDIFPFFTNVDDVGLVFKCEDEYKIGDKSEVLSLSRLFSAMSMMNESSADSSNGTEDTCENDVSEISSLNSDNSNFNVLICFLQTSWFFLMN